MLLFHTLKKCLCYSLASIRSYLAQTISDPVLRDPNIGTSSENCNFFAFVTCVRIGKFWAYFCLPRRKVHSSVSEIESITSVLEITGNSHTLTHPRAHTCTHARAHTHDMHTHARSKTHTHTRKHTHTHTHTHATYLWRNFFPTRKAS